MSYGCNSALGLTRMHDLLKHCSLSHTVATLMHNILLSGFLEYSLITILLITVSVRFCFTSYTTVEILLDTSFCIVSRRFTLKLKTPDYHVISLGQLGLYRKAG
jgi:hypothetical protein